MKNLEIKSIGLQLKDLDKSKRTAVIAHAAYNNIDQVKDISRKGMFTKSWKESGEEVSLYFNHDDTQSPGKVVDLFEDNEYAYTKAWFGTHTLGNDVLTMMDEGVIRKASFGYITEKQEDITVKGQLVRELKEVRHIETSVLTKMPANLKARVVSVTKSLGDSDISEIKSHIEVMESFCRNTKASDDCIISILKELKELKSILSKYDTAGTHEAGEPPASENGSDVKEAEVLSQLLLLKLKV